MTRDEVLDELIEVSIAINKLQERAGELRQQLNLEPRRGRPRKLASVALAMVEGVGVEETPLRIQKAAATKRAWTPERRAAYSEKMKAIAAARKKKKLNPKQLKSMRENAAKGRAARLAKKAIGANP